MRKALIIFLAVIIVAGCGCAKKDSKDAIKDVKVNKNKEVIKDREVDGLTFTNTSLSSVNKHWTLTTVVENKTGNDYKLNEFKITLKDKDDCVITVLTGYVGSTIPNNTKREINTGTYIDLSKVTKIEYEVVK